LFEYITNIKPFGATDFVVFLNKSDLFDKKIAKVPFTDYDADFDEKLKHNGEAVKEYYVDKFRTIFYKGPPPTPQSMQSHSRHIHFHVTCGVDSDQMKKVFLLVNVNLFEKNLQRNMLVWSGMKKKKKKKTWTPKKWIGKKINYSMISVAFFFGGGLDVVNGYFVTLFNNMRSRKLNDTE